MGKEYKITVTCENRDQYTSQWIGEDGIEIIYLLNNRVSEMSYLLFVDELANTTIFPKDCLMKSVIQIKERTT